MRTRSGLIFIAAILFAAVALWAWCVFTGDDFTGENGPPSEPVAVPTFVDVSLEAGVVFQHESGARGQKYNPETFGPGAGWLDYDGDGWLDLLLVNGNRLEGFPDATALSVLLRNTGDGRFEDVTAAAGLAVPLYGMGFVSGDVDNDGDQDLFLYGLHRSLFFRNEGGRFEDSTTISGLSTLRDWVGAAAFFDYDRDGFLDLFVGNYVDWSIEHETGVDCTFGTRSKKYCPVSLFGPKRPRLFRGLGDGRFEETTSAAGLDHLRGKALGVAIEDYDRDGDADIFVANDSVPNFLLKNLGNGRFEDIGLSSGFATDADGAALAGMGIDTYWRDTDHDHDDGGALVVAVGNFSGEPTTLHVQRDGEFFVERSLATPLGRASLQRVTFGLLIRDFDLDGELDLFQVNGHVFDVASITNVPHRQPPQLFLGAESLAFRDAAELSSSDLFRRAILGRALAAGDYDGDGDLDLVITENQGPARLYRNEAATPGTLYRVELRGTVSNRDAIGAEVVFELSSSAGLRRARRTRRAASSYLSQSERAITLVPLPGESLRGLQVRWPNGATERFDPNAVGRQTVLVEGEGTGAPSVVSVTKPPANSTAASNSVVQRQRGVRLFESERVAEALEAFEAAVAAEPGDFVALRWKLIALWRLKKRTELKIAVRDVAHRYESANFLVSHFALVLREKGYRELAARLFLEAVALDPSRADIWVSLGNLDFDRGVHDPALSYYRKALDIDANQLEALANAGKVHTLKQEFDRARAVLERALALHPDYAPALSTLGGIYIVEGSYDEAERLLLRANEQAPGESLRVEIHGNLGILYLKRRDAGRAAQHFQRVLELEPSNSQARKMLERLR